MKRNSASPMQYIASVDGWKNELLLKIRALIHEIAPDAIEGIEYGMLGYGDLCNLAAQKHYVSLYLAPKALAEYHLNHPEANCGKSCLRFTSIEHFDSESVKTLLNRTKQLLENGESRGC